MRAFISELVSDEFVEIINRVIWMESDPSSQESMMKTLDSKIEGQKQEHSRLELVEWKQFVLDDNQNGSSD